MSAEQVDRFIRGVKSGEIPSGRLMRLAVERHVWDLEAGGDRGLTFDERKAERACSFFPKVLRHSKGEWAGKPFHLTDSEAFIIWCVFGWQSEGLRRFTRAHIEVARKFGKSELASGVALKQGTFDDPPDVAAEINLAATKEQQVRNTTFQQCTRMIRSSPILKGRMKIQKTSLIVNDDDAYQPSSIIRPIGSDSDTSDGFDQSGAVLDELHAYRPHHQGFFERMTSAGGSRAQELIWIFTTAGDDKSEIWQSQREMAVRALESVETKEPIHDHLFALIACIDTDDDPLGFDVNSPEFERIMKKSNPNYPITPKKRYLQTQAREAQASPLHRNKFMRFHCNVQVSSQEQPFDAGKWKSLEDQWDEYPQSSFAAFDLGRSDDFSAWSVVWKDGERVRISSRSYTCKGRPEHLRTTQIQTWIEQGWLIEHPGDQVDFERVAADMLDVHRDYHVQQWAYDEHFAKVTAQQMEKTLGKRSLAKFLQTARTYNEPSREFLKQFKNGTIAPEPNPVLRWSFRNLMFRANSWDEWMPDKAIGKEYKIDAAVATLMAYGSLLLTPAPAKPWVAVL